MSLLLALLAGCSETPMGRSQLALMPDDIMAQMGREAFASMVQQEKLADGARNARVQCIAGHIIAAAESLYPQFMSRGEWEIAVFANATPNAFAMPGLRIGVFQGMLALAENDAQLAAVLGHEVGHVLASHSNERMTQELGINLILLLIGLFSDLDSVLVYQALGLGAQYGVILPFSRAHETEADLIGLRLMAAAGYAPEESSRLWINLSDLGSGQPLEFLSTHPSHDTRIENLTAAEGSVADLYEASVQARCP